MIEPRMAVANHYWNRRDIELEIFEGVRRTYDGTLTMSDDLTVINVTKDHNEVRGVTFNHESWPQGTSKEWDTAPHSEPATGLMSDWLNKSAIKGVNPLRKQPID